MKGDRNKEKETEAKKERQKRQEGRLTFVPCGIR
jgi:hypothetical protein